MKIKASGKNWLIILVTAVVLTLIAASGILQRLDRRAQDALFQSPKALSGRVVVIGIDEKALKEIGAYNTWDRNVMARALEALAADPEHTPAVTAIDTLYAGQTDPEADEHLARAAAALGNVITASSAAFGSVAAENADGQMYIDDHAILEYEEPYEALKAVTTTGHINAMYDLDGIMRHALLKFSPGGEQEVCSMAFETARLFARHEGYELSEPVTDKRGYFYVDFSALPGGFYDEVSIADLISGRVPTDYFEDKVVFIGPYAAGLQDAYFTPIDRAQQMYGVEFQANVVEALLRGAVKKEVSDVLQLGLLFLVSLIAAWLFIDKLKVLPSTIVTVLLIVVYIILSVLLYGQGSILHVLWIPISVLVIYILSIVMHYIASAIEKQRITHTFERYVAPEIVQEILREGTENLKLGGRTCEIAVLFVDVRGFTTMSERLSPEKVVYILNKYLTMASGCVEENRGTLDKFVGDAMMAFWGAPIKSEDPVYLAVKTAKGIVEGARRVSEELKAEIGEELNVGVGVHFGPAVVGNMGAQKHMDYTAIGDTVNTAARLEANAPGGMVYISRTVADALEGRITATSLGGTVKLKGKAEGFEVLRLETILE
ncbi:MAG: adenylate/guanylate cyclase domain-containing protein [Lachnospiraceae bacterium]|nr:adenylate/guanylate cyclase domain-containing protein [Lachnospiraceae bacterium]